VLAFDSFKGSLDATSAVAAVRRGIARALPEADILECPSADGGEGTVQVLTDSAGGVLLTALVHGPFMEPVEAQWGWIEDSRTAVVEVAEVAGLTLVHPDLRDPTRTTSFGLGELIRHALDRQATRIIVGLGGSATTDGGGGMAEALGAQFPGAPSPLRGGQLLEVAAVDLTGLDPRLANTAIEVALDVQNPLLGVHGAARVYGPQKGATPSQVEALEQGLRHLASFLPGTPQLLPGAGAAGGLGWGMVAFCGAELRSGIDLVLDAVAFEDLVQGADLVLPGEGSFDEQSFHGKVAIGIARRAGAMGIPTAILAGRHAVSRAKCHELGIVSCHSITTHFGVDADQAMTEASHFLEELAATVVPDILESTAVRGPFSGPR